MVGGESIQIARNTLQQSHGAGIYVASEPGWQTFGVDDVRIDDNVIRAPDLANVHEANILIWGGRPEYPVWGVRGSGNDLDRSKQGVRVLGAASDVSIDWFYG